MRRAFCRLSGERAGVAGRLCVFRRTRGAEEHCPGEAAFMGGRAARKTGERRAERNSGGGRSERRGTVRGKIVPGLTVRKAERPQATQCVCDRELTVCEGRNLRADGKCVWARRAESAYGVKPWIANSGRGRGVGRSGSACPPPPFHPPPSPPPPRKTPRKHSRKASGASRVFFVVSACALPESPACPAEDSRKHTPLCAPPGPDVLPDFSASAHGGGAGAALGKGKRISYDVMFFQVICFLFPSIRILLCRIR